LIPVCILGILQFFSPSDSPLNVYLADSDLEIATAGEFVRITGPFSYLQGLKVYLAVCFSLLLVFISQKPPLKWQLIYGLELTLVIVNSLMSGARAIIVYEILFVISYLVCLYFNRPKTAINFIVRMFLPATLAVIIAIVHFQPALTAFATRAETSGDSVSDRAIGYFTEIYDYAKFRADGYGTGATQGGANTLRSLLNLPNGEVLPFYEEEPGRVVLEIGILGFLLWYGLRVVLLISLYSIFLKLKYPFHKDLALAIFLFQIIHIGRQLVTDPTMLVYFWFFSGFIYLLPAIENRELYFDTEEPK
jgi:hypothetical protein